MALLDSPQPERALPAGGVQTRSTLMIGWHQLGSMKVFRDFIRLHNKDILEYTIKCCIGPAGTPTACCSIIIGTCTSHSALALTYQAGFAAVILLASHTS